MSTSNRSPAERGPLGQYLWDLRHAKKMTLREVETACEGISNAYLSQLETGQTRKPSPSILNELAELYGGSFQKLMELAGHISLSPKASEKSKVSTRLPTFAVEDLTEEEEEELLKYLAFVRMRKGKQ